MNRILTRLVPVLVLLVFLPSLVEAQNWLHDDNSRTNRSIFRPLDWPDPTAMRNAAGSPGPAYWQQRVDYVIEARLDTVDHTVYGSEHITYRNNSPDRLRYLWVQLDQNVRSIEHIKRVVSSGWIGLTAVTTSPGCRSSMAVRSRIPDSSSIIP